MRIVPGAAIATLLLRASPRNAVEPRCCAAATADGADDATLEGEAITKDGGLRKLVLTEGSGDEPAWAALVSVQYTGRFTNGTVFDKHHASTPFEFQLNSGAVIDGMDRGVRRMQPGETSRLTCTSRWAYGGAGVGSRIPPNETLVYDVELLSWKDGPPIDFESQPLDMDIYRNSLEGKQASSGQTDAYRWSEGGEEVTLWLPLRDGEGARDVVCDFRPKSLRVCVGADREVAGDLKGRAVPDESYWFIDEAEDGGDERELQIVLAKAGVFTRWDGVLIGEPEER